MQNQRARHIAIGAGSLVFLAAWCGSSAAQSYDLQPIAGFDRGVALTTGVRYESYSEDRPDLLGQRLGQLNVYLNFSALLSSSVRLDLASGWNDTNWQSLGDVSTANDTKLDVSYRPTEHFMIGAGINAPTGLTGLDIEELVVAQGIASRIKGYTTAKFGEGVDTNARVSYGARTGALAAAIGVGVLFKGHYTMIENQGDYDPGDQVSFSIGTDVGNPERLWRSNVSLTLYASDEQDGADIFEFGNRLRLETWYRHRLPRVSFLIRARSILRDDSKTFQPGAILNPETREEQGEELYAEQITDVSLRGPVGLLVLAGGRWYGDDDRGEGGGYRFDLGGGLRFGSKRTSFVVRGRGSFGRLDPDFSDEVSFDGWSVDASITQRTW